MTSIHNKKTNDLAMQFCDSYKTNGFDENNVVLLHEICRRFVNGGVRNKQFIILPGNFDMIVDTLVSDIFFLFKKREQFYSDLFPKKLYGAVSRRLTNIFKVELTYSGDYKNQEFSIEDPVDLYQFIIQFFSGGLETEYQINNIYVYDILNNIETYIDTFINSMMWVNDKGKCYNYIRSCLTMSLRYAKSINLNNAYDATNRTMAIVDSVGGILYPMFLEYLDVELEDSVDPILNINFEEYDEDKDG